MLLHGFLWLKLTIQIAGLLKATDINIFATGYDPIKVVQASGCNITSN
jgi:hypothetical protein